MIFNPPKTQEIEIIVFGPGFGESILIHIGNNEWFIVDSCNKPKTNIPYPIWYLEQLKINVEHQVKKIFVTHYHDDHINGISKIVEKCKNAEFWTSSIFLEHEFVNLVELYGNRTMSYSSGFDEFQNTLYLLNRTGREIKLINENKIIDREIAKNLEILGLSPSDKAIIVSKVQLSNSMPEVKTPKNSFIKLSPNIISSVIYFHFGNLNFLLGSDLENTNDVDIGWERILNLSSKINLDKCLLFKVPHHGSSNANHARVWSDMLENDPISLTTPWGLGGNYLPKNSDIKRISNYSENSYISSLPKFRKYRHQNPAVDRTITEAGIKIKKINSEGYIRVRFDDHNNKDKHTVECFGEAINIRNLLN